MTGVQATYLEDGRLHLNHGPIDLIIMAEGERADKAYAATCRRFEGLLEELVRELPQLRSQAPQPGLSGPVTRRMNRATSPHAKEFITPMAAVAGSVADTILAEMLSVGNLSRAAVNNGGDIAVWVAEGQKMRIALSTGSNEKLGHVDVAAGNGIGGIATSGRGGRSFSRGIADSVTVLARDAAAADAAATMIANAVDLPNHAAVKRERACDLAPDSDLGERLVVTSCARLRQADRAKALDSGLATAQTFIVRGLILGAALFLQGEARTCGAALLQTETTKGLLYA